jgi:hypothetical protein
MLHTFLISPMHSMCLVHLIFLHFVTLIVYHEVTDYEVFQCAVFFTVFLLTVFWFQKFFPVFYFQTLQILVLPSQRHTKLHTLKEQVVWLLNVLKFDSSVIDGEAVCKTSRNRFLYLELSSRWWYLYLHGTIVRLVEATVKINLQ